MDGERFALVTGAGSGVGKAAALALARTGWNLALTGRRRELLEDAATQISALGRRAVAMPCDVGDPGAVKGLFAEIESEFGRLDLLFNNAGTDAPAVPIDEFARGVAGGGQHKSDRGVSLCASAFGLMKRQRPQGGRIINNGSISAHLPRPMARLTRRPSTRLPG